MGDWNEHGFIMWRKIVAIGVVWLDFTPLAGLLIAVLPDNDNLEFVSDG